MKQVKENIITYGTKLPTDAELLSVFGITDHKGHTMLELSKMTAYDLHHFFKVNKDKAAVIAAAFELGRRQHYTTPSQLRSSRDAYDTILPYLQDLPHEEFYVIMLNRANHFTGVKRISTGGVSGTVVDAKQVFQAALYAKASSIILSHNHPSGNLKPSQADIDLTKKLRKAGDYMDIGILDHIIVAGNGYYSFSDEGVL